MRITISHLPARCCHGNDSYYLTSVLGSTALRAIQAVSSGITMMSAGFTLVRDLVSH